MRCTSWLDVKGVLRAVKQESIDPLQKAALMVEREAKRSMKAGGKFKSASGEMVGIPSAPGSPPHVQSGNLRASITHAMTVLATWIVGPTAVAWYGQIHEFGGHYGGKWFPPRPFMWPALLKVAPLFPALFRNLPLSRHKTRGPAE